MSEETNFEGKIVFKCTKCGWMYEDKIMADKCQKYCNEHDSCSINIVKHAIKIK